MEMILVAISLFHFSYINLIIPIKTNKANIRPPLPFIPLRLYQIRLQKKIQISTVGLHLCCSDLFLSVLVQCVLKWALQPVIQTCVPPVFVHRQTSCASKEKKNPFTFHKDICMLQSEKDRSKSLAQALHYTI